ADQQGKAAAFGAMPVQYIRLQASYVLVCPVEGCEIRGRDRAAHRYARQAERKLRPDGVEQLFLMGSAGRAVAQNADLMAGGAVFLDKIADVAENAADRRSEAVEDA